MLILTVAMIQVSIAQDTIASPGTTTATDVTTLLTAMISIYEIVVRLIKTKSNWSIIDIVWALIGWILPNNKSGSSFKWPWQSSKS